MVNGNSELKSWHDWTDPEFFDYRRQRELRFVPLFMRQLLPKQLLRTRLTLSGWFLIIVSMGIGTAAYNTASNILFMTLSLILGSLVLSGILSLINFRRLEWELQAPRHMRSGEVGVAEIGLRNGKSLFPSMCLNFRVECSEPGSGQSVYLPQAIAAGGSTLLEWRFIPTRRGHCALNLSAVESQFPFGFLNKAMGINERDAVIVWPQRVDYRFIPDAGGFRLSSGMSRRCAGLGTDLLNLRPYEPGDPLRLIHWKATARLNRLVVRQLAMEGEGGYKLLIQADHLSWRAAQFERMCSLAGSLVEDLFHAGRLEAVSFNGEEVIKVRSNRDLYQVLDRLALLESSDAVVNQSVLSGRRWIKLRPSGDEQVAIFVDENKAGQTEC